MNVYELQVKKEQIKDGQPTVILENHQVEIPTRPDEMTMLQWSNFHLQLAELPDWFIDLSFEEGKELEQIKAWTSGMWIEFYISVGKLLASISPNRDQFEKIMNATFKNEKDGDGILAMYSVLVNCINSYQPKKRDFFVHKNQKFIIPETTVNYFNQETVGSNLTTIEAIEALQLSLVLNQEEEGHYLFKDRKYKTDLALLATLFRRDFGNGKIERMPLDMMKRRSMIDRRMTFFEDVTFDIALDADFFLQGLLIASLRTRSFNMLTKAFQVLQ